MKISLLLPNLHGGGAERVSLDLADALADLGHSVGFILMREEGEFLDNARRRHSVVSLGAARARDVLGPLRHYISNLRPDALIASMWPLTFIAPVAAKLSRHRPRILSVEHNALSRQYSQWGRFHRMALRTSLAAGFRLAEARAGVSRGVADDVADLARFPRDKVLALYNPIQRRPESTVSDLGRAETIWIHPKGKRILSVGSLKEQKNQHLLLRAFHHLNDPAASLMIIGQGQLEPQLRQVARELGISDRVVFAGFHPDPTPFYQTADLFVLSSNYEGFGNVIVEALSCGLPVISTDCPSGPAEILKNGRYGRLTPVGDAEALAAAIQEAFAAPHDREALKRRAADFSPESAARAYLSALGLE